MRVQGDHHSRKRGVVSVRNKARKAVTPTCYTMYFARRKVQRKADGSDRLVSVISSG